MQVEGRSARAGTVKVQVEGDPKSLAETALLSFRLERPSLFVISFRFFAFCFRACSEGQRQQTKKGYFAFKNN